MKQELSIKELNIGDIKYLKKELNFGFKILFFLILLSVIFPCFCIYYISINSKIAEKTFSLLYVIICFGFWIYLTFKGIKKIVREKQKLYSQKRIEGNVEVLEKKVIRIKGDESNDTFSYQIKFFSEIEEKYKYISILENYYKKMQVGDFLFIEYYLECDYIKTLIFEEQNIKYKIFTK